VSQRWELGSVFVLRHAGFPFELIERLGYSAGVASAIDAVLAAPGDAAARAALGACLAAELPELRRRLREAASAPLVQEAVFMSNPAVYEHNWLRYLAADDQRPNAEHRRLERLVYTYLQRLCGKNETASFFGPMGYGEVEGEGWAEVEVAGPAQRRRVLFAHWAVERLGAAINQDPELTPHLPLRPTQLFALDGGRLRRRGRPGAVRVPPAASALLAAVAAGSASMAEAAAAAGCDETEAEAALRPLLAAGVLRRGLAVRGEDVDLLGQLTAALEALPPSAARDRWCGRLAELARLAREFQDGGLAERRHLLSEMEDRFTDWTGAPARRGEGQIYADRLVIFEEAASPFRVRFGRRLVRWLEETLGPALELSAAYGETVQADYRRQVAERLPGGPRTLLDYASALGPEELRREQAPPAVAVATSADGAAVLDPGLCGSAGAGDRYALLDVCLGAPDLGRADAPPEVVLSRVHHQLLLWSWLTIFHPARERVESSARRWLAARGASLAGLVTRRHNKSFYCFPGRRVSLDTMAAAEPGDTIAAADVQVVAGAGGPELRDAGGAALRLYLPLADHSTLPALAAFADPLVLHAPLTGEGDALPRLHAGGAVYQRRRWRAALSDLRRRRDADLLVEVARLRRRHGWPRFVYVRLADERKPYLIDVESPFACELLKHLAGRSETMTVEEMLPGPGQLWLRDERGRYTCELRWQASRMARRKP
jgi:Lantibiotic dehydratase, N terminus